MELPSPRSHKWSFADQAMVSGNNFFIGILLARTLGVDAFGSYVIATTYLLYANSLQSSLVVAPMMTAVPGLAAAADQHGLVRRFFTYFLAVAVVSIALVAAASSLLGHWSAHLSVAPLLIALLVATLAFQLQDWLRRVLYARSANRAVFVADVVAYGGQILGLLAEAVSGTLTAERALWVMAAAFTVSAVGCLAALRLVPDFAGGIGVIRHHWRASRDFLLSWQLQWVGSQGIILMGTGMIGPQAAGAIRAAQNLLGPINVFFQWMDNVVPVQAASRLRERGPWGLWHLLSVVGVLGVSGIAALAVGLWLVDDALMATLYGEAYRHFGFLIVLQALFFLVGHVYRMFSYYARATDSTTRLASASAWWALAAFLCAVFSVKALHEGGILMSLVVGEIIGVAYLISRHRRESAMRPIEAGDSHVVLRRGDGSVHLILPAAGGSLLDGSLRLYRPSRWTGRAYKSLLKVSLPWQKRLRWAEPTADIAGWRPYLDSILQMVPEASPDRIAGLVSGSDARHKIVIRLMDSKGEALAYVRIACDTEAIAALQREDEALSYLARSSLGSQVPRILSSGWTEVGGHRAFYVIQTSGSDRLSPSILTPRHLDFLARLSTDALIPWLDAVGRIEIGCSAVGIAGDALIFRALERLREAPLAEIRICTEHGDFVPWNIRSDDDGAIFVYDWERAERTGLPVIDALHFVFQQSILVDRRPPNFAAKAALEALAAPPAEDYLAVFGLDRNSVYWMLGCYLLQSIAYRQKLYGEDDQLVHACRTVLKGWVASEPPFGWACDVRVDSRFHDEARSRAKECHGKESDSV